MGLPSQKTVLNVEFSDGPRPTTDSRIAISVTSLRSPSDSVSMALWRKGPEVLGIEKAPSAVARGLVLSDFPALDEMWALYMLQAKAEGRAWPSQWQAMCHYVEDVRQGHWPDRVPPEKSVQAMYLAMAQQHLLRNAPQRERFLDDAHALCAQVAKRLEEGARMVDEPLLDGNGAFDRFAAIVAQDLSLYREDLGRSTSYSATIPSDHSPTGTRRTLPLLAVERPVATQFKLWARRDETAPGGAGFPLLLIGLDGGKTVLSADPTAKVWVGWLAPFLDEAEAALRGAPVRWYDGARHQGTLVAAPDDGTRLSLPEVVKALKVPLQLKRPKSAVRVVRSRLMTAGAAAVSLVATTVLTMVVTTFVRDALDERNALNRRPAMLAAEPRPSIPANAQAATADGAPAALRPGSKAGEPLPKAKVLNLSGRGGPLYDLARYAVIAGACDYAAPRSLGSPCKDARAIRELLVSEYGFHPDRIVMLVSDDRKTARPTAQNLRAAISTLGNTVPPDSAFLLFYSGHGGYRKGKHARAADYGLLQPSGFFDPDLQKIQGPEDRGWEMRSIVDYISRNVASRHVMVVLDACYSGFAARKSDPTELVPHLMSNWASPAQVVLTAGASNQPALEDNAGLWEGQSLFTHYFVNGLRPDAERRIPADLDGDTVVTDEELAAYLSGSVPAAVKAAVATKRILPHDQDPQFFRFDQAQAKTGQFVFVPREARERLEHAADSSR